MNLKSTAFLVLLATAAGLWYFKGDDWGPRIGLAGAGPAKVDSPSLQTLHDRLTLPNISRIEIAGLVPLVLEKAEGDIGWKMPGNWPLRKHEVQELVHLLTTLDSRFLPIPLSQGEDLSKYGLASANRPVKVAVLSGGEKFTLTFGEPPLGDDESPFTRSCYLRIQDNPELLRLGPDAMPVLRRSPDAYRRRQLFPDSERIKIATPSPFGSVSDTIASVSILTNQVKEIDVRFPGQTVHLLGVDVPVSNRFAMKRVAPFPKAMVLKKNGEEAVTPQKIADAWEITSPQRDRLDPEKLQKILTTIPELWVEDFASPSPGAGLDKPDRTLTVTHADGSKVSLLIGSVARTVEREERVSGPPPMPGMPPRPITRKITDEYRYAKLADNPQVFVVRADRLADLFVSADSIRDTRLSRFAADEVQEFTLAWPGKPPIRFNKSGDKWVIDRKGKGEPIAADASAVNDLLSQLSGLRSTSGNAEGDPNSGPSITVVAREKRPDDQPRAKPRTIVVHLGHAKLGPWPAIASASSALVAVGVGANLEAGTIAARNEDWPRVVPVEASILKALAPESGFRDRTLTNFTGADKLILERAGKSVVFTRADGRWTQTAPKKAEVESADLESLADSLGHLRAERYMAENPTPADTKRYGLESPEAKWTVLSGGKELLTLLVGSSFEGKRYAKLGSGDAIALLSADASTKVLANYRDRKIWELDEARVETIEIDRMGKKFKLARKGAGWEDPASPKDAIDPKAVSELLTLLGSLRADRWVPGEEAKKAGLEKPAGSIVLTDRDGKKHKLLLGATLVEGTVTKQFARADEPDAEPFLLNDRDASRLTRDRAEYIIKK